MTTKRFYFQIPEANVIDYVDALSLLDARAIVFNDYSQFWDQIQWLNKDEPVDIESRQCARLFF